MADANLGYQEPDTIDKLLDAESLTVGADTVYRERIQISGTGATDLAPVSATDGLLVNLGANNDVTVAGVSTAANQTTIIGHLDGVEGLLTTIDADTGNISTKIDTIAGAVSGTEMQVDVVAALPAGTNNIGDVDVLSVIPGTGATNLGKAIDTATGATDTGVLALVTRDDALSALTPVEGDNVPMRADANGALHMNMSYKLDSTNDSITAVSSGSVAHDAADSGNPVKIGGKARSSEPANVAADDRVDGYFDLKGRQIVAQKAATGTQTTVAGSASNVTLLAANTARLGASIYNDSTAILYVRLQATATTSNFTTKMQPDEYFEVPFGYTGIIDGIWASATGNARVTEIT